MKAKAGKTEVRGLEEEFAFALRLLGVPEPEREFRFYPGRRFRFDFAWPQVRTYVEIEGGTFTQGRHVRPSGYSRDCEKYNLAALEGWVGLRFTTDMLRKDPLSCALLTLRLLANRGLDLEPPGLDYPEAVPQGVKKNGRNRRKADDDI